MKFLQGRGATEIYVFGSRARGTARLDSDVDLAVRGLAGSDYIRLLVELEAAAECEVDLILLDEPNDFTAHIENKITKGWAIRVA